MRVEEASVQPFNSVPSGRLGVSRRPSGRHRRWVPIGWVVLLLALSGCYHVRLSPEQGGQPVPVANEWETRTGVSLWWGVTRPAIRPQNCMGNGLADVRYSTNFGYVVLTVLTLGIVNVTNVSWRCAVDAQMGGDFP